MIDDPCAWLEANADRLSAIVATVARRRRISQQEQEELLSIFGAHLVKNNYRVLRTFRGTSGVVTYLTAVADRLLLDLRTSHWGKWRASARARSLGPRAVMLERLVLRDGQPLQTVKDRLAAGRGDAFPSELTSEIAARVGVRKNRVVELGELRSDPVGAMDPFTTLMEKRLAVRGADIGKRLDTILRRLPVADQVLVRMRYEQGLRVSQIATMLRADQKKLYRRLHAVHLHLRAALMHEGLGPDEASVLISGRVAHLPRVLKYLGQLP